MIPGRAANALSANLPNNCDKAFNFTHSLAPAPFLLPPLVLPDAVVETGGQRFYSRTDSS